MKLWLRSIESLFAKCTDFIIQKRRVVILAVLLATCIFGYLTTQIVVNNSNDIFFVEGDPSLASYRKFQATFGSENFLLVYLDGQSLFGPQGAQATEDLVLQMQKMRFHDKPVFTQILSPFNAPIIRTTDKSITVSPALQDPGSATQASIDQLKDMMRNHPLYGGLLVNHDGSAGAIIGVLQADSSEAYMLDAARAILKIVAEPEFQILKPFVVGEPVLKLSLDHTTAVEASIFCSAAVAVCLLVLLLLFRRLRQVISTVLILIIAVIWTLGLVALFKVQMTLVSVMMPMIIIITGIGSCVHIISAFRRRLAQGITYREAIRKAILSTAWPCLFTSLTTAVGLLSMVTAPVTPMRTMGLFSAIGVMICYFLTLILLTAFLARTTQFQTQTGSYLNKAFNESLYERIAAIALHNPVNTIVWSSLIALVLSVGIFRLNVESNFVHALKPTHPQRIAIETVEKNLGGVSTFEVLLDSGQEGGVYDPEFLHLIERLSGWLMHNRSEWVTNVVSPAMFLREINRAFTGQSTLPDSKEANAQLMLLYEISGGNTKAFMSPDARKARLSVRTRSMSTSQALALEHDIRLLANNLSEKPRPKGWETVTGGFPLMVHLSQYVTQSQLNSFAISGLVIAILMILLLRSLWLGVASMVPNILPIFATYGVMGWLGWPLDWLSAIIPGVALGVAVDGTIHVGNYFQAMLKRGATPYEAAGRVIVNTGKALTISSLALCAGFGVIGLSALDSLARLGILLSFCLFMALLFNLFLTPAILALYKPKNSRH